MKTILRIGYDGCNQCHVFVLIFGDTFTIKLADVGDDEMGPEKGEIMNRLCHRGKIKVPGTIEIEMDFIGFELLCQLHQGVKQHD